MPILPILKYGNPVLRQPGKKVTRVDASLRKLAADMIETMHAAEGIGLAGPQIGKSLSIFVTDVSPIEEGASPMVFLNLEILESEGNAPYTEGCLSIPGVSAEVYRPERIMVRYMDLNREFHEGMATGILARVIQHELDHVHGKLFIDYLDKETLESFRPILAELEAGDHKEIANSV